MLNKIKLLFKEESNYLIGVFLLAFLIRIGFVMFLSDIENPELYEHGRIARNIISGHGFAMHWPYESESSQRIALTSKPPEFQGAFLPPLSPYLVALFLEILGDNWKAYLSLMILNSLIGAMLALPVYKSAKLLFGIRSARLSAIIAALYLPAAFGVVTFSGSVIFHFLFALIFLYVIKTYLNFRMKDFIILSALCGLMVNIRSEFLPLGYVYFAFILFLALRSKERRKEINFRGIITAFLLITVLSFAWIARNSMLFEQYTGTVSHPNHEIWRGTNQYATGGFFGPQGKKIWLSKKDFPEIFNAIEKLPYDQHFEIAVDSVFNVAVKDYVKMYPAKSVVLTFKRMIFSWTFDPYTPRARHPINVAFIMIALVPFWLSYCNKARLLIKGRSYALLFLISIFFIAQTAVIGLTHIEERYSIYLITATFPFWGWGMLKIMGKSRDEEGKSK